MIFLQENEVRDYGAVVIVRITFESFSDVTAPQNNVLMPRIWSQRLAE